MQQQTVLQLNVNRLRIFKAHKKFIFQLTFALHPYNVQFKRQSDVYKLLLYNVASLKELRRNKSTISINKERNFKQCM